MDNIQQELKDLYFINSILHNGLDYEEDEEDKELIREEIKKVKEILAKIKNKEVA